MSPRTAIPIALLCLISISAIFGGHATQDADGLPEDYPVSLSGGYSKEVAGTTSYIDYLQPGDTENYLIRVENPGGTEIRYRISVSGIPEGWLVFLENGNQNMPVDLEPLEAESVYLYIKNPKVGTANLLINVTDEGSERFWTITLQIVCQKGPLIISTQSASYILGREVPADFTIEVGNIGEVVLNVTLEIPGMIPSDEDIQDTWTVSFSERNFLIPPQATKVVAVRVSAPEFEPIGSQKVSSIAAKVDGITRPFSSQSLTFRVQTIYDLRTSVTPIGYQKVNPGSSVSFDLIIENLASETDYAIISEFSTPSGWGIGFNDTVDPMDYSISVDPESSRRFHPVVYVPPTAFAGKHDVIMKATGTSNETEFRLKVEVARRDAVEGISTPPSGVGNTYRMTLGDNLVTFEIWNRGNFFDTVTLELENRPIWAPFVFHSVQVGGGTSEVQVSGSQELNVSGADPGRFVFSEADLETLVVSLSPSQGVRITMSSSVSLDTMPESGVLGIRYRYGQLVKQSFLQLSLKLIIVDLKITDMDKDGLPDLKLYPKPDYELDERIHFIFTLENDYPYATREGDVKWRIELAGTVLLKGEVGVIQPGEEKEFNVSWKADKSTRVSHFAYLILSGPVYETDEQAPRAKSEDEVFIGSGQITRSWGLMMLFLGFMVVVMVIFIALFITAQRNKSIRESQAREKYDEIYSRKRSPELGGGRRGELKPVGREDRSLPRKEAPALPSTRSDDAKAKATKKKKIDEEDGIIEEKVPKRAPSLGKLGNREE
ncbi:MAG: hypothetical protein ACMUHY_02200 [Thermoplasmatota archaeon]